MAEFSGTLLGFDDYVSKLTSDIELLICRKYLTRKTDMVLEDVTELYVAVLTEAYTPADYGLATTLATTQSFPRSC